jgi:ketosteroid isomerase-like protein
MKFHPNVVLLTGFYNAFNARDADAMATAYTDDATFTDPVFVGLAGGQIGAMWRMLCERGTDLRVEATDIQADTFEGRAHWQAWYTFARTARPVHNVIEATFQFRDGKIAAHRDRFDFWRWSRQALGPSGVMLGWTPIVRSAVRKQARSGLDKYIAGKVSNSR